MVVGLGVVVIVFHWVVVDVVALFAFIVPGVDATVADVVGAVVVAIVLVVVLVACCC